VRQLSVSNFMMSDSKTAPHAKFFPARKDAMLPKNTFQVTSLNTSTHILIFEKRKCCVEVLSYKSNFILQRTNLVLNSLMLSTLT
jgi:hypothetical protein